MPTTTYDPQKNTFIKAPEIKICPTCGNPMTPEVKPMGTHMNNYMNADSGKIYGSINSNEDVIEIQGVKLYKVDGGSLKNPTSSFIPNSTAEPAKPIEKLPILVPNVEAGSVNAPVAAPANVTLPGVGAPVPTPVIKTTI